MQVSVVISDPASGKVVSGLDLAQSQMALLVIPNNLVKK